VFVWFFSVIYIDTSSTTLDEQLINSTNPVSVYTANTTLLKETEDSSHKLIRCRQHPSFDTTVHH